MKLEVCSKKMIWIFVRLHSLHQPFSRPLSHWTLRNFLSSHSKKSDEGEGREHCSAPETCGEKSWEDFMWDSNKGHWHWKVLNANERKKDQCEGGWEMFPSRFGYRVAVVLSIKLLTRKEAVVVRHEEWKGPQGWHHVYFDGTSR